MNEKVAAYLEEQRKKTREARGRKLVELGLWEKVFDPEEKGYSEEYPESEDGKFYRKAPVEVTDEEWADICRYAGGSPARNPVSRALRVIAMCIYIGGGVIGLLLCLYVVASYGGFLAGIFQAGSMWVSAAIFGTVMLGLSEVIRLLDR